MPDNKPTGIYFLQGGGTEDTRGTGVLVGFHQNLFGLDCMCTSCLGTIYEAPSLAALHLDVYRLWCQAGCGLCHSISCPRAKDHRYTCMAAREWERE